MRPEIVHPETQSFQGSTEDHGSESEIMAKFGITRIRVDNFYYGRFRYTNLDDAVAEAKRHTRAS